ncbi:MAG: hypothetical protein GXO77_04935 [Calditrichaeota bacterium]|nr:hypothetical protein [Calditrichota bacterium]
MEETFRKKVRHLYRVNRILWIGIFSGVVTLILVGLILHQFGSIVPQGAQAKSSIGTIFLIIALVLLYLVFYMKRTYLEPKKLIIRAQKKTLEVTSVDLADFIAEFGEKADVMAKTLILLRRYYMVIWSIANLITLLGFIEFVVTGEIRILMIYGVVSLYSLIINYPSFGIIERCYEKLNSE